MESAGLSSPKGTIFSLATVIISILSIGVLLMTHFNFVSHGSTAQVIVDKQTKNFYISVGIFGFILLVAALLYAYLDTQANKYGFMFGFTMISFLFSNIALTMSLYQVQIPS